jgi:beta-galactosidase
MKAAGFNAVRTSHNHPSEAFLAACDRIGLLVIDEAFDGWRSAKTPYDYSTLIDRYWQDDLAALVLRDRNHPSIFAWSVGNEVIERKEIQVVTTARKLARLCRELDPTRPVTSALCAWDNDWEIYDPLAEAFELVGYNYMIHKHASDHKRDPQRVMYQSESYPREAFRNWAYSADHPYIFGDFVWTSIDYQGESGIGRWYYQGESEGEHYHRNQFPWHAAYCGDIDFTGQRKPISYYRDLLWNAERPLYLSVKEPNGYYGYIRETQWSVWPTFESWTWPGHEGKPIEVEIYSRAPRVRLYINDSLVAERPTTRAEEYKAVITVPYIPGTLRAEAVDEQGNPIAAMNTGHNTLRTAGEPYALRLTADRTIITADGQDLSFITIEVVDKQGTLCPNAVNELTLSLRGRATLAAFGNADIKDLGCTVDAIHNVWKGRALAVVRASDRSSNAILTLSGKGLKSAQVTVKIK